MPNSPRGQRYSSPQEAFEAMADLVDAYPVKNIDRVLSK